MTKHTPKKKAPNAAENFSSNLKKLGVINASLEKNLTKEQNPKESVSQLQLELERKVAERTAELSQTNILLVKEINERHEFERALRHARDKAEMLAAIVESSEDAIVGQDLDGHIMSWNHGAETIFGYKAAEILGKPISILYAKKNSPDLLLRERVKAGERLESFETLRRRKDGTIIPISLMLSAIRNTVGDVVGISAIARDITERKLAEEQMRRSHAELVRLNQIKSEFTSIVSHELRTPLSALQECIYLVLDGVDGPVTEAQKETLGMAKSNVERLGRLINNVLDLTRLESGKLQLNLKQIDLNPVTEEVCQLMNMAASKMGITVETLYSSTPCLVECDSDRIKQVLINLIDNAIKFSKKHGTIRVQITHDKSKASISVTDNGLGIKEEDQERIFEKFIQTTYNPSGTRGSGLGLTICKKIMQEHHGDLTVTSRFGEGSCFTLTLPKKFKMEVQDTY